MRLTFESLILIRTLLSFSTIVSLLYMALSTSFQCRATAIKAISPATQIEGPFMRRKTLQFDSCCQAHISMANTCYSPGLQLFLTNSPHVSYTYMLHHRLPSKRISAHRLSSESTSHHFHNLSSQFMSSMSSIFINPLHSTYSDIELHIIRNEIQSV